MERELGKDLEQGKKRVAFLMDNCDAVEEKGYMKPFTPEELARMKESLSETDIEINAIKECVQRKEPVYLRGFGTFQPKKRAEKKARNITAGTTIIVPAHEVAHFKPSKSFTINK